MRARWEGADVVTARAVAPLARLAGWALPLLRTGRDAARAEGRVGGDRGGPRRGRGAQARRERPADRAMWHRTGRPPEHGGGRGTSARHRTTARPPAPQRGTKLMADGRTRDVSPDEASRTDASRAGVSRETSAYAEWTPIAEEAARAARVLHPDRHRMPRPAAASGADRRQPEGRRRQDHQHRQPRRSAGDARRSGPRRRPRPAGQRQHGPGRRAPVGHAVGLRAAARRDPARRGRHASSASDEPVVRAGDHRPRRRGDRARLDGRPRAAAQAGALAGGAGRVGRRLRPHRLPAVARPADGQRARRGRGGADPDPVRVLRAGGSRPAAEQHRPGAQRTSTATCTSRRSC